MPSEEKDRWLTQRQATLLVDSNLFTDQTTLP
jgi:hypothetical protein